MSTSPVVGNMKIADILVKGNYRKTFDQAEMEDLRNSIQLHGVLQPILLKKDGKKYTLIAGERRLRASIDLGNNTIPYILCNGNDDPRILTLTENLQRTDLNPIERGNAILELMRGGLTETQVGEMLGKSISTVCEWKDAAKLPSGVKDAINASSKKPVGIRKIRKVAKAVKAAAKKGASEEEQTEVAKKVLKEKTDSKGDREWVFNGKSVGTLTVEISQAFSNEEERLEIVEKMIKGAYKQLKSEK